MSNDPAAPGSPEEPTPGAPGPQPPPYGAPGPQPPPYGAPGPQPPSYGSPDPQPPSYGSPQPPSYGSPQPPSYGSPQPPSYGSAAPPPSYGSPDQPQYGAPPPGYGTPGMSPGANQKVTTALVLGISSIVLGLCCWPLAAVAGGVGLYLSTQAEKEGAGGNVKAAKITSAVGLGLAVLGLVLFFAGFGLNRL